VHKYVLIVNFCLMIQFDYLPEKSRGLEGPRIRMVKGYCHDLSPASLELTEVTDQRLQPSVRERIFFTQKLKILLEIGIQFL